MSPSNFRPWLSDPRRATLVMGILNVTPDSFSDGGKFALRDAALAHADAMVNEGADWIDIGAESTRPGSTAVSADEQLQRLLPLLAELRKRVPVVLSIDTTEVAVAEAALDAGVDVVNDISAGRHSAGMFPLLARRNAPVILMHMQGTPATMQHAPHYRNVADEVVEFLAARVAEAVSAGVARENILVDPGIGFGKTAEHNLQLLRDLSKLSAAGWPVVVGTSRKAFLGKITGESAESGRIFGTAASVAWAAANGAAVVRVHDARAMKQVVRLINAIRES